MISQKNWDNVRIHVKTKQEKLAALELLSKMTGRPISPIVLAQTKKNKLVKEYPVACSNSGEITGGYGTGDKRSINIEFDKIHELLIRIDVEPIMVKLNDEYTAEVRENEVIVGCQKFPFIVVEDLFRAVEKQKQIIAENELPEVEEKDDVPF